MSFVKINLLFKAKYINYKAHIRSMMSTVRLNTFVPYMEQHGM